MRTFEVAVALPRYTPMQALHMQQDERFQQWNAAAADSQRLLLADLHLSYDGMATENTARVSATGALTHSRLLSILGETNPTLTYDETTRFSLPAHASVAAEVLAPSMAAGCVHVNVDIAFDPIMGGTCRTLRGRLDVDSRWWLPERTRAWVEECLATQLQGTLQASSQRAVAWAQANPNLYPDA